MTLCSSLQKSKPVIIPWYFFTWTLVTPHSARLDEFCDASTKAYAVIIFLTMQNETQMDMRLMVAKIQVCPCKGFTIPHLEFLSALLLSKLVTSVQASLGCKVTLDDPMCFIDSQVALCWICGCGQE